jgi:hypothetical protein
LTTISAPKEAYLSAMAFPIPRPEPVINATLFFRLVIESSPHLLFFVKIFYPEKKGHLKIHSSKSEFNAKEQK